MRFRHANKTLKKMDEEPGFRGGFPPALAQTFAKRMHAIRQATNENTLRNIKSFRFERLKGKRQHEYSIRLNDQFRLIFQIEPAAGGNQLVILAIEDYH
jgi:proteic killer suppression protein